MSHLHQVYRCPSRLEAGVQISECLGGRAQADLCAVGSGTMCADCPSGTFYDGAMCEECSWLEVGKAAGGFLAVLALAGGSVLLDRTSVLGRGAQNARLVVVMLQGMAVALPVQMLWPNSVHGLLRAAPFTLWGLNLKCALRGWSDPQIYVAMLCVPLIFGLIAVVALCLRYCRSKASGSRGGQIAAASVAVFDLMHQPALALLAYPFIRHSHPSGKDTLAWSPTVEACDTDDTGMFMLALAFCLPYVALYPTLLTSAACQAQRGAGSVWDPIVRAHGLEDFNKPYWPFVVCLRRFLLGLTMVVASAPITQTAAYVIVLLVFVLLQSQLHATGNLRTERHEQLDLVLQLFFAGYLLYFASCDETESETLDRSARKLFWIVLVSIVLSTGTGVWAAWSPSTAAKGRSPPIVKGASRSRKLILNLDDGRRLEQRWLRFCAADDQEAFELQRWEACCSRLPAIAAVLILAACVSPFFTGSERWLALALRLVALAFAGLAIYLSRRTFSRPARPGARYEQGVGAEAGGEGSGAALRSVMLAWMIVGAIWRLTCGDMWGLDWEASIVIYALCTYMLPLLGLPFEHYAAVALFQVPVEGGAAFVRSFQGMDEGLSAKIFGSACVAWMFILVVCRFSAVEAATSFDHYLRWSLEGSCCVRLFDAAFDAAFTLGKDAENNFVIQHCGEEFGRALNRTVVEGTLLSELMDKGDLEKFTEFFLKADASLNPEDVSVQMIQTRFKSPEGIAHVVQIYYVPCAENKFVCGMREEFQTQDCGTGTGAKEMDQSAVPDDWFDAYLMPAGTGDEGTVVTRFTAPGRMTNQHCLLPGNKVHLSSGDHVDVEELQEGAKLTLVGGGIGRVEVAREVLPVRNYDVVTVTLSKHLLGAVSMTSDHALLARKGPAYNFERTRASDLKVGMEVITTSGNDSIDVVRRETITTTVIEILLECSADALFVGDAACGVAVFSSTFVQVDDVRFLDTPGGLRRTASEPEIDCTAQKPPGEDVEWKDVYVPSDVTSQRSRVTSYSRISRSIASGRTGLSSSVPPQVIVGSIMTPAVASYFEVTLGRDANGRLLSIGSHKHDDANPRDCKLCWHNHRKPGSCKRGVLCEGCHHPHKETAQRGRPRRTNGPVRAANNKFEC